MHEPILSPDQTGEDETLPIYDLYSRRKRKAEQTEPEVYQYDAIPEPVRTQIVHIWRTAIGPYYEPSDWDLPKNNNKAWKALRDALCREKGRLSLANRNSPLDDCVSYLLGEDNIDELMDVVEITFGYIWGVLSKTPDNARRNLGITQNPKDAVKELNFRLREGGVGYQFESGKIVRVDSQFVHAEVVKPALILLTDPRFAGPQDEFLSAHAHYRAGEHKDAVIDANNAYESTLKTVCDIKGWEYPKGARASDLVKVVRDKGLLPDYLDKSFDQLAATLKSGLPQVRNEEGSHGQGAKPKRTPGYIAAYALHLAAAKIVLLVEAMKATER